MQQAAGEGYAVFFVTGRPGAQEAATLGNLTDGNPACSTIEYKSATPAHVESMGYDVSPTSATGSAT